MKTRRPEQVLFGLAALLIAWSAAADPVRGVRPVLTRPIAPRGGVMLLELEAGKDGDNWPQRTTAYFASGEQVEATVVWIEADDPAGPRRWTDPSVPLRVRAIEPGDDSSTRQGRPLLLLEVPEEASGAVRLFGVELDPLYVDAPTDPPAEATLERSSGPDRPDADSPFEYWRWVLLARRLEMAPPEPVGTIIEQQVARYHADLWRLGMNRLRRASKGVADACLELLTATCTDRDREIAAWVTDEDALQLLLEILLNPERGDEETADDALTWADTQDTMFFWLERDQGRQIQLAMANPRRDPRLVRFRWVFGDPQRDREEIPIMVELAPHRVTHVRIDRPGAPADEDRNVRAVTTPQLEIVSEGFSRRFEVRPDVLEAKPPGLSFGPFFATLTLADARAFRAAPPPADLLTTAELRRRGGRWEVFFECFRPNGPAARIATGSRHLFRLSDYREIRGNEAVTIVIGLQDDPPAILSVPEIGEYRLWAGEGAAASLEVRRSSWSDRWWCTVVLPDAWIGYPLEPVMLMGFIRSHGESERVETAPIAPLPWAINPGRAEIDLHPWRDLPGR